MLRDGTSNKATQRKTETQFARELAPNGGELPALLLQDPLLPSRNLFFAFLSVWEHSPTKEDRTTKPLAKDSLAGGTTPIQVWRHALLGGLPTEVQQTLRPRLEIGATGPSRGVSTPNNLLQEVQAVPRPGGARDNHPFCCVSSRPGLPFCSPSIGLQSLQSSSWALQDLSDEQRTFLPVEPMDVSKIRKVVAIDAEWAFLGLW